MELNELERRAKSAGGQEWTLTIDATGDAFLSAENSEYVAEVGAVGEDGIVSDYGKFIAAANPAVVLELVRRLREAEATTAAARDVLAERRRQIEAEGWTPEHDDEYTRFELARAGACYAEYGNWPAHSEVPPNSWPWPAAWWKPSDYRRNLVKAAALILAEIERLDRIQPPKNVG